MKDSIEVWPFHDAPEEFKKLSTNGGDEDWLALVPVKYTKGLYLSWLEDGTPFGCAGVCEYPLPDGRIVFIGAHA